MKKFDKKATIFTMNYVLFFIILDHVKLYNHPMMDPDHERYSIQRKVQYNIRFFYFRRGAENMDKMIVNDFTLDFYQEQEIWYLYHTKDELTKKPQISRTITVRIHARKPY